MNKNANEIPDAHWRQKLHQVIFEAETTAGKTFDIVLIWTIILSVLTVVLESLKHLREEYGLFFYSLEWTLTILFTIEYILRLMSVKKPLRYALSFYGIVDFLAIAPTYISFFHPGLALFINNSNLKAVAYIPCTKTVGIHK